MILYESGYWGIGLILQLHGSVSPKAICWALPNAILAAAMHAAIHHFKLIPDVLLTTDKGITLGMGGYTMVLGFLLVFRTREAYSRWWESVSLLQQTRGEWFGAYSNLFAFCSHDPSKAFAVDTFQHLLVRLMSLLYACALEQVSTVERCSFEVFDLHGIEESQLEFLSLQDGKMDIVLQWIQQLIVCHHRDGVLDIAPPILSRVFQELSRGKVNITNAQKITEFPFPFPYAQLLAKALLIQWFVTPVLMCILCEDLWWAGILAFTTTFFMWSINYVGMEIEEPYGSDANDLPLREMQQSYNTSLMHLLMPGARRAPKFSYEEGSHRTLRVSIFGTEGNMCKLPGSGGTGEVGRLSFASIRSDTFTVAKEKSSASDATQSSQVSSAGLFGTVKTALQREPRPSFRRPRDGHRKSHFKKPKGFTGGTLHGRKTLRFINADSDATVAQAQSANTEVGRPSCQGESVPVLRGATGSRLTLDSNSSPREDVPIFHGGKSGSALNLTLSSTLGARDDSAPTQSLVRGHYDDHHLSV